ncbi:MAG TPA: glycosyltransferase family 1 protein [Chloroflexi bacterium]|nr:glycosyltransferase family 1 protein [Chloroflexota bacterium]
MALKVLYAAFDVVPSPKGASRHITHFVQSLASAGHEVTLFTVWQAGMAEEESYAGARVIRCRIEEGNFLRRALLFGDAVWEHLRAREGAYDVVHFRDIWSGTAAVEARRHFGYRYRTVFEANGLPSVELKYHYPAVAETSLPNRLRAQERELLRRVDAVICVSRITEIFLRSLGAPVERIAVIPNGVDVESFRPGGWPPPSPPRLVYIGTLASWQGLETVIEAMPLILAAFPDACLRIIGPGKSKRRKMLEKLASKLGLDEETVRFEGSVPPGQVPACIEMASVCLIPLAYNDRNVVQGCCPVKVLEYAAAARPIVAADLPVVRELLGEGEAFFFPPGDASALAERVVYVLSHPEKARATAERARRRVEEGFTWERAGQRLLEIYSSL